MPNEKAVDMSRIATCKYCGVSIVWLKSERTGNMYPVNYDGETNRSGHALVTKNAFHDCPHRRQRNE